MIVRSTIVDPRLLFNWMETGPFIRVGGWWCPRDMPPVPCDLSNDIDKGCAVTGQHFNFLRCANVPRNHTHYLLRIKLVPML
jgi:hypothetical protein